MSYSLFSQKIIEHYPLLLSPGRKENPYRVVNFINKFNYVQSLKESSQDNSIKEKIIKRLKLNNVFPDNVFNKKDTMKILHSKNIKDKESIQSQNLFPKLKRQISKNIYLKNFEKNKKIYLKNNDLRKKSFDSFNTNTNSFENDKNNQLIKIIDDYKSKNRYENNFSKDNNNDLSSEKIKNENFYSLDTNTYLIKKKIIGDLSLKSSTINNNDYNNSNNYAFHSRNIFSNLSGEGGEFKSYDDLNDGCITPKLSRKLLQSARKKLPKIKIKLKENENSSNINNLVVLNNNNNNTKENKENDDENIDNNIDINEILEEKKILKEKENLFFIGKVLDTEKKCRKKKYLNKINRLHADMGKIYKDIFQSTANTLKIYKEKPSCDDLSEYFNNQIYSVKEYAYKEDQNFRYREYMEDKGKMVENYFNNPDSILFCLFDGHGGNDVSEYLQKNFYKKMKEIITFDKRELTEEDFINLFQNIDQKFKEPRFYKKGSTCCIVYITKERNNKKVLYCVNIGDTRCIMTQQNGARILSQDDLATDDKEARRIKEKGGEIVGGRVEGELMISRAFGDWEFKEYGVICEPHVNKIEINKGCKYVIIASDGVWDVVEDIEAYTLSLSANNSLDLCRTIVKRAIEKGSKDNISCFVIKMN